MKAAVLKGSRRLVVEEAPDIDRVTTRSLSR